MISDVAPALRREVETSALQAYVDELAAVRTAAAGGRPDALGSYKLDRARRDYARCGMERWVWLTAVLVGYGHGLEGGLPPAAAAYFWGQVLEFARDHWLGPASTLPVVLKPVVTIF
jgi:hypothetical protein